MNKLWRLCAIIVILAGLLALASYFTTGMFWDGGFPQGEFRVDLKDADGKPVQGAILRVYHGGTRTLAFQYPLDNHVAGKDLASDEQGRITAVREQGGLQFGGFAWLLFWVIPMGAKAPQYDCAITADGFKPLSFQIDRLFEMPYQSYEDFPKSKQTVDGKEIELPIYQHTFTLQSK